MTISVATVFPQLYQDFLSTSLIKRAQEKGAVSFDIVGFADVCAPKERLDGPTAGHGAGMAIRPEVIERIVAQQEERHGKAYKIFVTPQGKKLDQRLARQLGEVLTRQQHVIFFAGRYEGIDQRAHTEYADLEISIGDYVLMGGDLPVMVALEATLRYLPGVVGQEGSVEHDSFTGPFVDYPTYTVPPREWKGHTIPEILLSGNHAAMEQWRYETAVKSSVKNHFEWVRTSPVLTKKDQEQIKKSIPAHYVALMHDQVVVNGEGLVGTSSVASLDIHDIARSSRTYGIKRYFLVTPLKDQQEIVKTFLGFWKEAGISYNENRADAISIVALHAQLEESITAIRQETGKEPLIIATSARSYEGIPAISYHDQGLVWAHDRPVLFLFGTARGLSRELIERCDYLLGPLDGLSDYNHLSVRSAVAIILDRWMGLNPVCIG